MLPIPGFFCIIAKMEDHRHSERQPVMENRDFVLDVVKFKQLDRSDHHGHIVDISRSGIGIESNTPMEPGLVWFRDRIWGQYSGVLLWSKQVGSQYRSGIRFASLPRNLEPDVTNQSAPSGFREPLKDLERLVAIQLDSIKKDTVSGSGTDRDIL